MFIVHCSLMLWATHLASFHRSRQRHAPRIMSDNEYSINACMNQDVSPLSLLRLQLLGSSSGFGPPAQNWRPCFRYCWVGVAWKLLCFRFIRQDSEARRAPTRPWSQISTWYCRCCRQAEPGRWILCSTSFGAEGAAFQLREWWAK